MSAELSRRVEKVVGYPPLSELDALQRREFHEALLEAATFEDLYAERRAREPQTRQQRRDGAQQSACGHGRAAYPLRPRPRRANLVSSKAPPTVCAQSRGRLVRLTPRGTV